MPRQQQGLVCADCMWTWVMLQGCQSLLLIASRWCAGLLCEHQDSKAQERIFECMCLPNLGCAFVFRACRYARNLSCMRKLHAAGPDQAACRWAGDVLWATVLRMTSFTACLYACAERCSMQKAAWTACGWAVCCGPHAEDYLHSQPLSCSLQELHAANLSLDSMQVGNVLWATVQRMTNFGCFLRPEGGEVDGLLHISAISKTRVDDVEVLPCPTAIISDFTYTSLQEKLVRVCHQVGRECNALAPVLQPTGSHSLARPCLARCRPISHSLCTSYLPGSPIIWRTHGQAASGALLSKHVLRRRCSNWGSGCACWWQAWRMTCAASASPPPCWRSTLATC